jgi:hypothetical protein
MFCSCGLSPLPSGGVTAMRWKGFDANSITLTKKQVTVLVTAATYGINAR